MRALKDAAELVRDLLDTRGYPDSQENKLMALLSVKHAGSLVDYRRALLTLRRAQADVALPTAAEERVAMVSFRTMFDDVLGAAGTVAPRTTQTVVAALPQTLPQAIPTTQVRQ